MLQILNRGTKGFLHVVVITLAGAVIGCEAPTAVVGDGTSTEVGEISPTTLSVKVGESGTLGAQLRNGNGALIEGSHTWDWTADPAGIVNLVIGAGARNATVTGVKPGQTTVRASRGPVVASALVTVVDAPQVVTSLNFIPGSLEIGMGETGNFTCVAFDAQGVAMNNVVLQWTSSTAGVATVANGRVTAVSPGSATITCSHAGSGLTRNGVVTVRARVLKLNRTSVTVNEQQTARVGPTVEDFRGNLLVTPTIIWTSASPAIATVMAVIDAVTFTPFGEILGVAAGGTTVTASLPNGEASAAVSVTVVRPSALTVTIAGTTTMQTGNSVLLNITVRDAAGNAISDPTLTFTSSDATALTVLSSTATSVVVRGLKAGTHTFTVNAASGAQTGSATVQLTVT